MTYDGNTDRPVFIDIDGTLTDKPNQGGNVLADRIAHIRKLVGQGQDVVIWSGGGTDYARHWVYANGLADLHDELGWESGDLTAIGKPEVIVDDNPDIRPKGRMPIVPPEDFFK